MAGTPCNALNITQTGLVKFDGVSRFTGVTTTQHDILVGAANNGITNVGPGVAGQILQSGGASADPSYSTTTYPATNAINTLLYASSANTMAALSTANSASLTTNGTGVPTWIASSTSWTPIAVGQSSAGTATYSIQIGRYVQLGPLVILTFSLAWTGHSGTGGLLIGGLPVAPQSVSNLRPIGNIQLGNSLAPPGSTVDLNPVIAGEASSTQIFIQTTSSSGNAGTVSIAAAGAINGTVIYFSA